MSKNRSIMGGLSTLIILGVSGFLVWKYALNSPQNMGEAQQGASDLWGKARDTDWGEVLDGLDGLDFGSFFDQDPKLGDNTTYSWHKDHVEPNNGGLHLTLVNVLTDDWQQEFDDAIADWKESPALTLTTERGEVDSACTRKDGVMIVCNNNFGETGWVGINENEIVNGMIISSVSKMNEYYLNNAEYDHRRYTMCHEVGHGFGLPHTDENPYNANLGNCLDYTDDPSENLHPGQVNFDKLDGMYLAGRRTLRRVESDGRVIETHYLLADNSILRTLDENE
jgi:predicted Zn-dependent protease|eukprot:g9436.t1 g9436   contig36:577094-578035(-)